MGNKSAYNKHIADTERKLQRKQTRGTRRLFKNCERDV
ncbi:hypothetical protein HHE06_11800 [Helicobacter heilmannii]|nr:hypothetical protein HHE06_11800 [Helicobacter heilmannii]